MSAEDDLFDQALNATPGRTVDPRALVVEDDAFKLAGKRGRWGRPQVTDPATGQETEYERPSTVAKKLDDQTGLIRWAQGMAALGTAENSDILDRINSLELDGDTWKKSLYNLGEQAKEAASPNRGADWGTLIHQTIGAMHRGEDPDIIDEIRPAIDAYLAEITRLDLTPVEGMIEVPIVNDHHRLAGTFDVLYRTGDGRLVVGDWKTNNSLQFLSWGVQLAIYAGATAVYNPTTGERSPATWAQDIALIVHIDYRDGDGKCDIYELDMDACTGALLLALEVSEWRKTAKRHASLVTLPYQAPEPSIGDRLKAIGGIDMQAAVDAWNRANLPKPNDMLPSHRVVAIDVLDELETRLGMTSPTASDWRAWLRQLPPDLAGQARSTLMFETFRDTWNHQAPEAALIVSRINAEHAERVATVTRALDGMSFTSHAQATNKVPIRQMTKAQATRTIAVCHAAQNDLIDMDDWTVLVAEADLVKQAGGKRGLLDLGKRLAKTHGLVAPKKAADVAASPVLTALAAHHAA